MTENEAFGEGGHISNQLPFTDEVSHAFLERIPGGLFRYHADEDAVIDFVSNDLLALFGCDTYEQFCELTNNTFWGMVHPDDLALVKSEIETQIEHSQTDRVTYRLNRFDDAVVWVDDCGRLVVDEEGVAWFYVTLIDVTEKVLTCQQLERVHERLEILTALSNDVVFDIECATGNAEVFGDFEGRFGREPEQTDFVVHRRCHQPCTLTIQTHSLDSLTKSLSADSLVDFELSTPDEQGNPIWFRYQSVVLYDEQGKPYRHVGRLLDTHEMALRESQFRLKAERDALTGIFNRAAAMDRIDTALATTKRPCTLVLIDVDDFKHINDTYGHPEGDRVLKELAHFLAQLMRKEDVVARFGGDEFLIFAEGLGPGEALDRILGHLVRTPFASQRANDMQDATQERTRLTPAPTISIGAVCFVHAPSTFEEFYSAADEVLYAAKHAGKAQFKLEIIEGEGA
ncbi:diguanylate cyclase [Eggerthellaceae bacterium 3-80]|nr:sensor domain-containing diguanylate cyclase [bacterium D16-34]